MCQKQLILWACWFNCDGPKPSAGYIEAENEKNAIDKYFEGLENSKHSNVPDRDAVRCKRVLPEDVQGLINPLRAFVYKILGTKEEKTIMAYDLLDAISQIKKEYSEISGIIIRQLLQEDISPVFPNI